MNSRLKASRLVEEPERYIKFNDEGETQMVSGGGFDPDYSYRKVHYSREDHERSSKKWNDKVFVDPEYNIQREDFTDLIPGRKIVLKRVYDIYRHYPKGGAPEFFSKKNYRFDRATNLHELPNFANELGLFNGSHYRSLFVTQDFQKSGLYEMVINQNGRWETQVVDDLVPVFQDSLEPIWGMDFDHSWQIILLKMWAKKKGGYRNLKEHSHPFEFIEYFSNSNWKYFNIAKDGINFLNAYSDKHNWGKFVLKTKDSSSVEASGLMKNKAGYEVVNIVQTTGKSDIREKKWNITVRSTLINQWAGEMSVLDKTINTFYTDNKSKANYQMALERDFVINHADFINLFSAGWVGSVRDKHKYFSNYYLFRFPPGEKNSVYLEFEIKKPGWFDFCVKQNDDQLIKPTDKSNLRNQEEATAQGRTLNQGRYLKVKFLLAKELEFNETTQDKNWAEYNPPKYELYEVEYLHGYNRGDARFEDIVPGHYILRIKPETTHTTSTFVVNYASNNFVEMREADLSKRESSMLLRQSMTSLIGDLKNYSLDTKKKSEQICFGNLFEEIGYGFVGVRSKKTCPYNILIDVDPEAVRRSGYKIKNQFKHQVSHFSLLVKPGESTAIVLKKIEDGTTKHVWPPAGIEVFRSK